MTKRYLKKIPTSSVLNFCRRPASKSCGKNAEQNSPSITLPADNLKTISKTTVPPSPSKRSSTSIQTLPFEFWIPHRDLLFQLQILAFQISDLAKFWTAGKIAQKCQLQWRRMEEHVGYTEFWDIQNYYMIWSKIKKNYINWRGLDDKPWKMLKIQQSLSSHCSHARHVPSLPHGPQGFSGFVEFHWAPLYAKGARTQVPDQPNPRDLLWHGRVVT